MYDRGVGEGWGGNTLFLWPVKLVPCMVSADTVLENWHVTFYDVIQHSVSVCIRIGEKLNCANVSF